MAEPDSLPAAIATRLAVDSWRAKTDERSVARRPKLVYIASIFIACFVWRPNAAEAQYYAPTSGALANHNHHQQYGSTEHLAQLEQQYAAHMQQQQQQQAHQLPFPMATFSSISSAGKSQQQSQPTIELATSSSTSQSRSTRSIGEMFKKLFNANKRSKQSGASFTSSSSASSASLSPASSTTNGRDWDQNQHNHQQQQLQQQQQQHNQQQALAAQMAVAAANQHAVYASPYPTTAITQQQPQATLYAQNPFAGSSYPAGLLTWPSAAAPSGGLAQAYRGQTGAGAYLATPSAAQAPPQMTLVGSGPLYAAASQSYSSYLPAPSQQTMVTAPGSSGGGTVAQATASNPSAAASHTHASAVPAPAGMMAAAASQAHPSMVAAPSGASGGGGSSSLNSIDFHQVLDALVRSSGFTPAGDGEAAYASKPEGTPVFSFKKLISMPFYLSTEDKSLDGLAHAGGGANHNQGYLHSMPIMRRHVRRMSTGQQQQQQNQQQQASGQSSPLPFYIPNESIASYQQYNNYINELNSQLAAMAASGNQQQQQIYDKQFLEAYAAVAQQRPTPIGATTAQASPTAASAAESALANYYASSSIGNRFATATPAAAASKTSTSLSSSSSPIDRMIGSASMINSATYPSQQVATFSQAQRQSQVMQQRQPDEIQAIINNLPQWLAESSHQQTYMAIPSGSAASFMDADGNYRHGISSQQPTQLNQNQNQNHHHHQQQQQQQQLLQQQGADLVAVMNQAGSMQQLQQAQQHANQKDGQQAVGESGGQTIVQQASAQQVQSDSMQTQSSTVMSQQVAPTNNNPHQNQQQQTTAVTDPSQTHSVRPPSSGLENNGQSAVVNGHHNQASGSPGPMAVNQSVTYDAASGSGGAPPPSTSAGLNQLYSAGSVI